MRYFFKSLSELLAWIDGVEDQFDRDTDCLIVIDDRDKYYDRLSYTDINFESEYHGWPQTATYQLITGAE